MNTGAQSLPTYETMLGGCCLFMGVLPLSMWTGLASHCADAKTLKETDAAGRPEKCTLC